MAVDDAPPLVVIGMEGLWGTLIMLVVFPIVAWLPGRDMGSIENTWDSLHMVAESQAIQARAVMVILVCCDRWWTLENFHRGPLSFGCWVAQRSSCCRSETSVSCFGLNC